MEIVKFKSRCVRDILRTVVITTNAFARMMLVVCHGCGVERETGFRTARKGVAGQGDEESMGRLRYTS